MDLRPVSQPVVAGDRAVLYVAASGGLRVVALDLATGTTVWSRDATTSDMAPGEEPELAVMGDEVIYLAKAPDSGASVTAVDAERGSELWSTPGDFNGTPAPCPGAPSAVCVTGLVGLIGAVDGINEFDAATGRLLAITALGDSARDVGDGLFDPGDRDPERLTATGGDRVLWSRPLRRIFPAGFTTDWGWEFSRYDDLGLFAAAPNRPPADPRPVQERDGRVRDQQRACEMAAPRLV
jgi:hypothetical protein